MMRRLLLATVLILLPLVHPAAAADRKASLEVGVSTGYDDNPLELPADQRGGAFSEIEFDARANVEWKPSMGLFVRADGLHRMQESGVSDADQSWADLRAGLALTPWHRSDSRFSVAVGGSYGLLRATYVDPATGEPYRVLAAPSTEVALPERIDFDQTGAFVDLRWRTGKRLLLYLDSELSRRDYLEDYDDVAGVHALDDRTVSIEPGLRVRLTDLVTLDMSVERADLRYDELPSLDASAQEVAGSSRHYSTTRLLATLLIEPRPHISVMVGLRGSDRRDAYAGYYDYAGMGGLISLGYDYSQTTRFTAYVSRFQLDYDRATIDNDPATRTRASERLRMVAHGERDLNDHLTLFFRAGADRTGNEDRVYAYDRTWAQAGLKMRL